MKNKEIQEIKEDILEALDENSPRCKVCGVIFSHREKLKTSNEDCGLCELKKETKNHIKSLRKEIKRMGIYLNEKEKH